MVYEYRPDWRNPDIMGTGKKLIGRPENMIRSSRGHKKQRQFWYCQPVAAFNSAISPQTTATALRPYKWSPRHAGAAVRQPTKPRLKKTTYDNVKGGWLPSEILPNSPKHKSGYHVASKHHSTLFFMLWGTERLRILSTRCYGTVDSWALLW